MVRVSEWVLGIAGAFASFLGLFILLAGDDQYLGIIGTWPGRVGDIASSWGYGLVIVGVALLVAATVVTLWDLRHGLEHRQQSEYAGLLTHIFVFLGVNAFLWAQDILAGGGLEYAWLVTLPWGIGLLCHIGAYVVGTHRSHQALPHH
jgi:hypothetical protein